MSAPGLRAPALLAALLLLAGCAGPGDPPPGGPGAPPSVPAAATAPAGPDAPAALAFLRRNARGHEEWWRERDGAVVIRVPAGAYLRRPYSGTAAVEEPEPVAVDGFLVDRHETTNAAFALFLRAEAAAGRDPVAGGLVKEGVPGIERREGAWAASPGLHDHPVTAATGAGAAAFAAWVGGRLPTPDEWMKAAGGPEGNLFPWGEESPDDARANFGGRPGGGPDRVGSRPAGASPCGALDMAGNVYERVLVSRGGGRADGGGRAPVPAMIKGGSWLSPHPLNLRVLDLCMQDPRLADGSVGFRVFMDEPAGLAAPAEAERPTLRLARDLPAAIREARERRVPLFLSLLHDTCGQCDRTIAQVYRDPAFVRFCNERLVVVVGHHPADAGDDPHPAREDGACTVHEGLTCREHVRLYNEGLRIVGGFPVSPGNFVLDPFRIGAGRYRGPITEPPLRDAEPDADLVPPESLPKGGASVEPFLAAFEAAARRLAERLGGR